MVTSPVTRPRRGSRRRIAILVGLAVTVLGAAGMVALSHYASPTDNGSGGNTASGTVTVYEAASNITSGQAITAANLKQAQVAASAAPTGYITSPAQATGQVAAHNITAGQPLTITDFLPQAPTATRTVAPPVIKDGDVAISVPDDALKGDGGYIQPGDHIDIIVDTTGNGTMQYGFQDVPVLQVGSAGHAAGGVADLLVVELPRRQAEEISVLLAQHSTGASIIRYVLRPADQDGKGYLDSGADSPAKANGATNTPNDAPVGPSFFNNVFK